MKLYEGTRCGGRGPELIRVAIGSQIMPLEFGPSQKLRNHSPDGFNWGYGGSGPAQLALALLLDATGNEEDAQNYYQAFKTEFVAGWGDNWSITDVEIELWLDQQKALHSESLEL